MEHMKGPWKWSGSDLNGINEKGEIDSVIFCTVEYDDGHYSELHCEEDDRALIESAPDLLAECEAFCAKVESGKARSTDTYNRMKAVIAKARRQ